MKNVIKFPKEKTQLYNQVLDFYDQKNYKGIYLMKDRLLDALPLISNTLLVDVLIEATFKLYLFEETIMLGDELIKRQYESYDMYYFMLLSYIGLVDIYQAKALINRSKLLNEPEFKKFYQTEGANYTNILSLDAETFYSTCCLLLIINYINEVAKEMAGDIEIDKEYLLFRFFDLINMVYEIGYDHTIIQELEEDMKVIFEIGM